VLPTFCFRFPKDAKLSAAWENVIRQYYHNWTAPVEPFLCSAHFQPDDFYRYKTKCYLKSDKNVVPSVFHAAPIHTKVRSQIIYNHKEW
jgi:hypothetical protein